MTIPSSLLIEEIMHYEGFSKSPVQNRLGMPCIGYGFPLWEEALNILHANTRLARSIKNSMPKEQENMDSGMKRLLALPLTVTEKQGRQLLVQSLLYYAEELSKKYTGFRHLVNQCGEAVIYPQSSFAQYEGLIALQNPLQNPVIEEKTAEKGKKRKQYTGATQKQSISFLRQHGSSLNRTGLNSSETALHPAFLQSFYSSSEAFAGANPFQSLNFFGKSKKQKKQKETIFFPLTEREQALLRVDSVLFVTHLLGLDITLQMHDFFLALQQDNYAEACSQLLSHSSAAYLGTIISVLARRIREARLDYGDIALQKTPLLKKQKRGRKPQTYLQKYFQNHSFNQCGHIKGGHIKGGQRAGAVYGA